MFAAAIGIEGYGKRDPERPLEYDCWRFELLPSCDGCSLDDQPRLDIAMNGLSKLVVSFDE
jgi:hypothetical protein